MRNTFLLMYVFAFLTACGPTAHEGATGLVSPDTILTNGKIYTLNSVQPWAEAVAIKDGKYIYVGSNVGAITLMGKNTQTIDLHGNMAMPGINDAHVHPIMGAIRSLYHCQFPIQSTPQDVATALRSCVAQNQGSPWIIGGQWGSAFFQQYDIGSPREWLDNISDGIAIALYDDSYHNIWFNSKALELAGISNSTPDPEGGTIGRDTDGKPDGLLFETAAQLGEKAIPDWSHEQYIAAVREVLSMAAEFGITGIKDAGAGESMAMAAYYEVDTGGDGLTVHLAADIRTPYGHRSKPLDITALEKIRDRYGSNHLSTNFVKIFLDGVPTPARTAAMLDPYLADDVHGAQFTGKLHVDPQTLKQDLIALDAKGFTVKMHSAGDRSVRVGLDAIEAARNVNGFSGLRHELAHAGYIHPDDIPRFAALDAVADISPILWHPSPIITAVISAVGPRGMHYFPVRDLLNAGALVVAGTDWPAVTASASPWGGIEALVTRKDPAAQTEGQLWADQAIMLEDAIQIYTLNGAQALRMGELTGSIEVGKSADLIVLDRNLFTIPIDDVGDTQVTMTYFEGRLVGPGK